MTAKTNLIFWRLAYFLIVEQEYILLNLNKSRDAMVLENRASKEASLIRLSKQELSWAAGLAQDGKRAFSVGAHFRSRTGRRKVSMVNIIVSQHLPVDEFDRFVAPAEENKVNLSTILMTEDDLETPIRQLAALFDTVPGQTDFSSGAEEEAAAYEKAVLSHETKRKEEENRFFHYGKPFFTYLFTAVNIAMFFLLTLAGGSTNTEVLLQYGAKFNPLILEGEWWRFITPVFLHIGFLHLVMNSLALYYLGTAVEQIYGRLRFLWIYLFSGFTGSLLSFLLTPNLSAGASGAIFGLFGALLYFGVVNPKLFFRTMGMNVIGVIAINLVFGFTVPGIDNAGHIGGLLGGFLATGIVHFPKKWRLLQQTAFLLAAAASVGAGLYFGFQHGYAAVSAQSVNIRAAQEIDAGNEEKAGRILTNFLASGGEPSAETYFYLGYTAFDGGQLSKAEEHFQDALALRDDFHEAHFNLALIYMEQGKEKEALRSVQRALEYRPGDPAYENLLNRLNEE